MTDDFLDLQYRVFLVHERPLCLWGTDIRGDTLQFLDTIDPVYFEHVADTFLAHVKELEPKSKEAQYAALAIRAAYSQSLETLFALVCALLQAPNCPHAWLINYQSRELFDLVRKIHNREAVLTGLTNPSPDWPLAAEIVFSSCVLDDKTKQEKIKSNFASLWSGYASQFLDHDFSNEYNAIKHSLRVRSGGFFIRIAPTQTAQSPQNFQLLGASDFGAGFFTTNRIGELAHHLQAKTHRHNWSPEDFAWSLHLVSMSISNVVASLKILNGVDATQVNFHWPSDDEVFQEPSKRSRQIGVTRMKGGQVEILPDWIEFFTKDELVDRYKTGKDAGVKRLHFSSGDEPEPPTNAS